MRRAPKTPTSERSAGRCDARGATVSLNRPERRLLRSLVNRLQCVNKLIVCLDRRLNRNVVGLFEAATLTAAAPFPSGGVPCARTQFEKKKKQKRLARIFISFLSLSLCWVGRGNGSKSVAKTEIILIFQDEASISQLGCIRSQAQTARSPSDCSPMPSSRPRIQGNMSDIGFIAT